MKLFKLKIGFLTMACASMFLVSCGGGDKKNDSNVEKYSDENISSDYDDYSDDEYENISSDYGDVSVDEIEDTPSTSSSNNCEEFLNGYEKFMDKYIAVIKKMKNNPSDMSVMTDYTSMMTEATEWSSKTADCAADAEFAAKFAAIQMKIANAASGM
jgi:hypothetical protein